MHSLREYESAGHVSSYIEQQAFKGKISEKKPSNF